MVTYASKNLDYLEQMEMALMVSATLVSNMLWQEYVEGLDEQSNAS